jgi:hypothetical protein
VLASDTERAFDSASPISPEDASSLQSSVFARGFPRFCQGLIEVARLSTRSPASQRPKQQSASDPPKSGRSILSDGRVCGRPRDACEEPAIVPDVCRSNMPRSHTTYPARTQPTPMPRAAAAAHPHLFYLLVGSGSTQGHVSQLIRIVLTRSQRHTRRHNRITANSTVDNICVGLPLFGNSFFDRHHILGPDEHSYIQDSNTYTNAAAGETLQFAADVAAILKINDPQAADWIAKANAMYIPTQTFCLSWKNSSVAGCPQASRWFACACLRCRQMHVHLTVTSLAAAHCNCSPQFVIHMRTTPP